MSSNGTTNLVVSSDWNMEKRQNMYGKKKYLCVKQKMATESFNDTDVENHVKYDTPEGNEICRQVVASMSHSLASTLCLLSAIESTDTSILNRQKGSKRSNGSPHQKPG